jgi:hypothetical protein
MDDYFCTFCGSEMEFDKKNEAGCDLCGSWAELRSVGNSVEVKFLLDKP